MTEPEVVGARIVQIVAAGTHLEDEHGNIYAGWALCEFYFADASSSRDILPFGTDGGLMGTPGETYYDLHALGDFRPNFAHAAQVQS